MLYDFESYPSWNPLYQYVVAQSSPPPLGSTVDIAMVFGPDEKPMTVKSVVLRADKTVLSWRGYMIHPWLVTGVHTFEIEALGENRTKFVQKETFSGLLAWLVVPLLGAKAEQGFGRMNVALGDRAMEKQSQSQTAA